MLYKTICIPVFDYCDIIYDNLSQKDIFRLQKLQNSALRIISRSGRRASKTELHHTYHLDYLVSCRHKHACHYAYTGFNDMSPKHFCDLFESASSQTSNWSLLGEATPIVVQCYGTSLILTLKVQLVSRRLKDC